MKARLGVCIDTIDFTDTKINKLVISNKKSFELIRIGRKTRMNQPFRLFKCGMEYCQCCQEYVKIFEPLKTLSQDEHAKLAEQTRNQLPQLRSLSKMSESKTFEDNIKELQRKERNSLNFVVYLLRLQHERIFNHYKKNFI